MDFALARLNMVRSQLAPNRIHDPALLAAFKEVPREDFVVESFRDFAYSDKILPQAEGRMALKPLQTSWLIQAMELTEGDKVLVVGAGAGYEVAILARLGLKVFALESDETLAAKGQELAPGEQVQWKTGALDQGWPEEAPFDGIILMGAAPGIPNKLIGQLGGQGRLLGITGSPGDAVMQGLRMVGIAGGDHPEPLFETQAPALPGFENEGQFQL